MKNTKPFEYAFKNSISFNKYVFLTSSGQKDDIIETKEKICVIESRLTDKVLEKMKENNSFKIILL